MPRTAQIFPRAVEYSLPTPLNSATAVVGDNTGPCSFPWRTDPGGPTLVARGSWLVVGWVSGSATHQRQPLPVGGASAYPPYQRRQHHSLIHSSLNERHLDPVLHDGAE